MKSEQTSAFQPNALPPPTKTTTMSKGKFPRSLEAHDSPKMRMPAFSMRTPLALQLRPLPGIIFKDLRNDIISCELMYKKAIRKTRRLKGNKIFGTFIPAEANYLVFLWVLRPAKRAFRTKTSKFTQFRHIFKIGTVLAKERV